MSKNGQKFSLDIVLLVGIIMLMVPKLSGQIVHEWAGLIIAAVVFCHLLINRQWVKVASLKFFRNLSFRTRFIYILDSLIFLTFAAAVISGMYTSKTIDFSWLGISKQAGMGWKMLHNSTSYLSFLLAGVHIGINLSRVLQLLKPSQHMDYKGGISQ